MRFGWFIALPLLFVALLAGSCGYAMGAAGSAVAPVAAAPAAYPMWGFGWFFPFFGFIFFLIVISAIVGGFKRRAWGGRGGWYGPGYGQHGGYKQGNAAFEEWHRRMHGEPSQPSARKPVPDEPTTGELVIPPWEPPADPPTPQDENTKL
jgi:hypothetical protein